MIRRHGTTLRSLLMIADAIVAVVVVLGVYLVRFALFPGDPAPEIFSPAWPPLVVYAGAWVTILYGTGQYRLRAHWSIASQVAGLGHAVLYLAVLTLGMLYLTRIDDVSRVFIITLFPAQWGATVISRAVVQAVFMRIRRQGRNLRFMIIAGTGSSADAFARSIRDQPMLGIQVIGAVSDTPPPAETDLPYLGTLAQLGSIMRQEVVDEVAICLATSEAAYAEDISRLAQEEGKIVRIPLDIPPLGLGRSFFEELDGTPVLTMVRGPDHVAALAVKRLFDIAGSVLGLVVLLPLLLCVAIYVQVQGGGPVLFSQERVGMNGRRFQIHKFRTMVADAEDRYHEVRHLSQTRGAAFKMADDPRVTSWGRWMRMFSIDELPQLWNVLRGDMSLVGPRPAPPREVDIYDPWQRRRLSMKPGLTGLWQISSRLDDDFDERASLDLEYIDRWSLSLDLKIVVRTVPAVLRPAGR